MEEVEVGQAEPAHELLERRRKRALDHDHERRHDLQEAENDLHLVREVGFGRRRSVQARVDGAGSLSSHFFTRMVSLGIGQLHSDHLTPVIVVSLGDVFRLHVLNMAASDAKNDEKLHPEQHQHEYDDADEIYPGIAGIWTLMTVASRGGVVRLFADATQSISMVPEAFTQSAAATVLFMHTSIGAGARVSWTPVAGPDRQAQQGDAFAVARVTTTAFRAQRQWIGAEVCIVSRLAEAFVVELRRFRVRIAREAALLAGDERHLTLQAPGAAALATVCN